MSKFNCFFYHTLGMIFAAGFWGAQFMFTSPSQDNQKVNDILTKGMQTACLMGIITTYWCLNDELNKKR